jgi:hypothetical protein
MFFWIFPVAMAVVGYGWVKVRRHRKAATIAPAHTS